MSALEQGKQLEYGSVEVYPNDGDPGYGIELFPLRNVDGTLKATKYRILSSDPGYEGKGDWVAMDADPKLVGLRSMPQVQFRDAEGHESTILEVSDAKDAGSEVGFWQYLMWFTAMVGFWATMSISISDITRYAKSQKDQLAGQFIGLPGTMLFYSFVGIFVTSAAVVAFDDVLIAEDAPWDPVSLVGKFKSPVVVIFAQLALLIATLSTNIAANVIAPANAFSNLFPKKISFRVGGVIAGLVGILICPWWLMDEISGILMFVSGLLGPVLGILLCDYFLVRKRTLVIADLYKVNGPHAGVNSAAMIALFSGVFVAIIGYWVKPLEFLYTLSWFSGTTVAFAVYWVLMGKRVLREG